MEAYTCPMHPEIEQERPGRCPKCGMTLVLKDSSKNLPSSKDLIQLGWKNYVPLFVIFGLLIIVTFVFGFRDFQNNSFQLTKTISYFMIGFFLTFSGFKLLDLQGFAEGYYTYDLLAQRFFAYGYIYPFIELFFGLSMILLPNSKNLLIAEIVVMAFSGLGVAIKLWRRERFQCSCLGTFLKVPLTKVTLIEDFGMAALALILLLFS